VNKELAMQVMRFFLREMLTEDELDAALVEAPPGPYTFTLRNPLPVAEDAP
jgi:hypothetical protein